MELAYVSKWNMELDYYHTVQEPRENAHTAAGSWQWTVWWTTLTDNVAASVPLSPARGRIVALLWAHRIHSIIDDILQFCVLQIVSRVRSTQFLCEHRQIS